MTQEKKWLALVGFESLASIIVVALLAGCSSTPSSPSTPTTSQPPGGASSSTETAQNNQNSKAKSGKDDEIDDLSDDSSSTAKKGASTNKAKVAPISIKGKETGEIASGIIAQQQNEFLGLTSVKLCKYGVRMDSPNITVIIPAGAAAQAYNAQNGSTMPLTAKTTAFMSGSAGDKQAGELKTKVLGTEIVCGKKCTHYKFSKDFVDAKTKEVYDGWNEEVWATKDLLVPDTILSDCARMTMLPKGIGFPLRIVRFGKRRGSTKAIKTKKPADTATDVISTLTIAPTKLDKGEFIALTGFKPVKDEMQFMMSSNDADLTDMDDLDKETEK